MKKISKIVVYIGVILLIICLLQKNVFACSLTGSSIWGQAKAFINKGGSGKIALGQAQSDLMPIGNILFGFAIMVLLVVGSIMGVKYMISGADEKANMKQKLVWYVIAAVLIFSATGVYNAIYSIITKATN